MYLCSHLSLNINAKIIHADDADRPISPDYQFYLVQKGTVKIRFKRKTYTLKSSDIIMIPPDEDFVCSGSDPNTLISIRMDKSYIDSIIPVGHELICNSTEDSGNKDYDQLADVMIRICSTFFADPYKSKMISLIYEFTYLLQNSFIHKIEDNEIYDIELHNRNRINLIIEYMHTYYSQNLSLSKLAKKLYLTPQYLSKFIKKYLGTTFSAYLINIRMEHALNELLHTNHSVTEIAFNNGFSNVTAFNKIFKQRYHVSPTNYRQRYQAFEEETQNNSEQISEPTSKVFGQQSITISVNKWSSYQKPWQNTINIGPLSNALKNSFHEYFMEYQKSVSVKYIRFYNMFTEDLLGYDEEMREYNFTNLDCIIDFLYRNNIVPFVELRYKPAKGYVNIEESASAHKMFEKEKDISYYYRALSAILKHYLNKYGSSYMSQWRFEVWMKCDEDLTPLETPYQYAKIFEGFYKIIKDLLPKCEIGGPGFNMSGNFKDFTKLLSLLEQYNTPFDFISVYAYCYELQPHYEQDDFSTIGIISLDANHIINNFTKYQAYVKTTYLYKELPLYITEFGSTVSVYNHVSESLFQAAFFIKNMIGLSDFCDCVAYSYFIDTTHQFTQNTNSFPGLISENGIPKPSLHAYTFLNYLGKYLISKGEHYILTSNSNNNYHLLCYQYTHFSKSYCFNSWDNVPLEQTYEIFDRKDPVNLQFSLEGIHPGRYKVTQFSLNRNYGSVLDKYLRILDKGNISSSELLHLMMSLREDEVKYYKQTAVPRQDIYYLTADTTLELNVTLGPHEIIFYEFNRIL